MENLQQILENLGYKLKNHSREWSARPLYRDSDNDSALSINKDTGDFYDFVIGAGGDIQRLIELTTGQPLTPDLQKKITSDQFLPVRKQEIEIPVKKTFDKSLLLNLVKDYTYWNKRGISDETLKKFEGGVAINGKMRNRFVFPIFNERNELIGFNGRYIYKSDNVVRWKIFGQKNEWVFPTINYPIIHKKKEIILVEGIGDLLSLFEGGVENTLSTFGVKLSPVIIKFLLKSNLKRIIIALNNDSLNNSVGNRAAEEFKKTLEKYFDSRKIEICLPPKKDFGEMDFEEILEWKKKYNV